MDTQIASLAPVGRNEAGDTVHMLSATVDMGRHSEGGVFEVRDGSGRLVFSGQLPAGSGHVPVVWDGAAADGSQLPGEIQYLSASRARWRFTFCACLRSRHRYFGCYRFWQSSHFEFGKRALG